MEALMLEPGVRALLDGANFVHVCTLMPDGSPHSTVVWGATRGDRAAFFTNNPSSLKGRNIARDPRISMSLVDRDNPYRSGFLRGRVVEKLTGDQVDAFVDEISIKFVGRPFPMRNNTLYLVDVESSRMVELPFEDRPA
jgi:PPOX class probable F420-dependent enzyme